MKKISIVKITKIVINIFICFFTLIFTLQVTMIIQIDDLSTTFKFNTLVMFIAIIILFWEKDCILSEIIKLDDKLEKYNKKEEK